MTSPSTEPTLLPVEHRGSEPGDGEFVTLADLASGGIPSDGATAYVAETDARYIFVAGDATDANGWTVVDPGSGRWVLASDSFSISPLGGGQDDWPRLVTAWRAAASSGVPVEMEGGAWSCFSLQPMPDGLDLIMNPDTVVTSFLVANPGSPGVAPFLTLPGGLVGSSTIAAENTFDSDFVTSTDDVALGTIVRIRDTETGSGFHGGSYTVIASEPVGDGTFRLVLDRPVRFDFGPGDVIDFLPVMPDVDIFGNGATITGSGTRLMELLATRDSVVDGLNLIGTSSTVDLIASFDSFGYNNEFRNMNVQGAGFGTVGLALESQDSSRVVNSTVTGAVNAGIMLYDCVDSLVLNSHAHGNGVGLAISADGNVRGSLDTRVEGGSYNDNFNLGIGIQNGSGETYLIGVEATGNVVNLLVGDLYSTVTGVRITGGDFSGATTAGIRFVASYGHSVLSAALSGSPFAIQTLVAAGEIDIDGTLATLLGATGVRVTGSAYNDLLQGSDGDDLLRGGRGADILSGGAGNDTAVYTGEYGAVSVNLATGAGKWNAAEGDMLSLIENLVGTAWNDVLTGNASNNVLTGGVGADRLDGGGGIDTASYANEFGAVSVNLATGVGKWNAAEGDRLSLIENVVGTAWNDVLTGNASNNVLTGGLGADLLDGGLGADHLDGGGGTDTASYANAYGAISVNLATGVGKWNAAEGDILSLIENVVGTAWNDVLVGNASDNVLAGGLGADRLEGGLGADHLDGGGGIDTASYANAFGAVWINLATGEGRWNAAHNDSLTDIENLIGTNWNDRFDSNSSDNVFTGGLGDDLFWFAPDFGQDTITDWSGDTIRFNQGMFNDFADMMSHTTQVGANTVIEWGGNTLTLSGVQLGTLESWDFIFG